MDVLVIRNIGKGEIGKILYFLIVKMKRWKEGGCSNITIVIRMGL